MSTASQLLGLPVPSEEPLFLLALGAHLASGISCVAAGALAALSPKRRGLHPRAGLVYAWGMVWLFASSGVMAAVRWPDDIHLLAVSAVALVSSAIGYGARLLHRRGWMKVHLVAMSVSYVALLTGFYVDNGPNLPAWRHLPRTAFWILPTVVGVPIVARAWQKLAAGTLGRPDGATG